jgi:hypothetical protein
VVVIMIEQRQVELLCLSPVPTAVQRAPHRTGKDTGYGRFPSRVFAINAVWLDLALTAADLIAWTQTMLLDGDLATAEPKKLRYQLLHAAARITRGQRRIWVRINETWPWATHLAAAFTRLNLIPAPT